MTETILVIETVEEALERLEPTLSPRNARFVHISPDVEKSNQYGKDIPKITTPAGTFRASLFREVYLKDTVILILLYREEPRYHLDYLKLWEAHRLRVQEEDQKRREERGREQGPQGT